MVGNSDDSWISMVNVGLGQYLGINGAPADGVPVVAVSFPYFWQFKRDSQDSSRSRILAPGGRFAIQLSENGDPVLRQLGNDFSQTWRFEQTSELVTHIMNERKLNTSIQRKPRDSSGPFICVLYPLIVKDFHEM